MREKRTNKTEKQGKKASFLVVGIIGAVVAAVVIGAVSYKVGYNKGFKQGEIVKTEETEEELKELAKLMLEKARFKEGAAKLSEVTQDSFTSDNIGVYVDEIRKLESSSSVKQVKEELEKLASEIEGFKEIFEGKNNQSIEEKFNELAEDAKQTETTINELYNSKIAESLRGLDKKASR